MARASSRKAPPCSMETGWFRTASRRGRDSELVATAFASALSRVVWCSERVLAGVDWPASGEQEWEGTERWTDCLDLACSTCCMANTNAKKTVNVDNARRQNFFILVFILTSGKLDGTGRQRLGGHRPPLQGGGFYTKLPCVPCVDLRLAVVRATPEVISAIRLSPVL